MVTCKMFAKVAKCCILRKLDLLNLSNLLTFDKMWPIISDKFSSACQRPSQTYFMSFLLLSISFSLRFNVIFIIA